MARFLSEEYMGEATAALNGDEGFATAAADVELALQFMVTDSPEGDVNYYLNVAGGQATMALGEMDGVDASVTTSYETAEDISKGEQNVQTAFMFGKIKLGGNMAKVMMHQRVINEWTRVQSSLEVEY